MDCNKEYNRMQNADEALKELGTGMATSSKMIATELCAAVELNVKNEVNGPNIKAVIAAINIERRKGNDESETENAG